MAKIDVNRWATIRNTILTLIWLVDVDALGVSLIEFAYDSVLVECDILNCLNANADVLTITLYVDHIIGGDDNFVLPRFCCPDAHGPRGGPEIANFIFGNLDIQTGLLHVDANNGDCWGGATEMSYDTITDDYIFDLLKARSVDLYCR